MSRARRWRDSHAFAIFLGGVILLFGFFVNGLYIGRWSRLPEAPPAPPAPAAAPAEPQPSTERLLVEVEVTDSRERAQSVVSQLRREYTSATFETDRADGRYHVYVGPYAATHATTVAEQLRQLGFASAATKPYRP